MALVFHLSAVLPTGGMSVVAETLRGSFPIFIAVPFPRLPNRYRSVYTSFPTSNVTLFPRLLNSNLFGRNRREQMQMAVL